MTAFRSFIAFIDTRTTGELKLTQGASYVGEIIHASYSMRYHPLAENYARITWFSPSFRPFKNKSALSMLSVDDGNYEAFQEISWE